VVACRVAPTDGDVIRISQAASRLLIGHFEFCREDGFVVGDVCTNPLILSTTAEKTAIRDSRASHPESPPGAEADVA
jgi:hypothetical protein